MNPSFPYFRGPLLTATFLAAVAISNPAEAQRLSRAEYLDAVGLTDDAEIVRRYLLEGLAMRAPDWDPSRREDTAEHMSFVLAVSGITYTSILGLQSSGVDVVHAVAADSRPFGEQALLADLVVVGEVVDSQASNEPEDGFDVSAHVRVLEHLKGEAPADTIVIRHRLPRRERDIHPEIGDTYLLLLSRGMYRFGAANDHFQRAGIIPASWSADLSVIYRIYRMHEGRIEWNDLNAAETAAALEDIRRIDNLLNRINMETQR